MGLYDTDETTTYDTDEDYSGPAWVPAEDSTSADTAPRPVPAAARTVSRGGWANARTQKEAASPFPSRLAPDSDGLVIKFLGDGPYTSYRQHWINEIKEGQRVFPCLDGVSTKGCPLCDAKHRATPQFQFNVALISLKSSGMRPVLKTYNIGPTIFDQLSEFHTDPRQGPLQKHYWVVKRSKNGTKWQSTFFMQRAEDLDDYILPEPGELEALPLWDESVVRWPTYEELADVAAKYLVLE